MEIIEKSLTNTYLNLTIDFLTHTFEERLKILNKIQKKIKFPIEKNALEYSLKDSQFLYCSFNINDKFEKVIFQEFKLYGIIINAEISSKSLNNAYCLLTIEEFIISEEKSDEVKENIYLYSEDELIETLKKLAVKITKTSFIEEIKVKIDKLNLNDKNIIQLDLRNFTQLEINKMALEYNQILKYIYDQHSSKPLIFLGINSKSSFNFGSSDINSLVSLDGFLTKIPKICVIYSEKLNKQIDVWELSIKNNNNESILIRCFDKELLQQDFLLRSHVLIQGILNFKDRKFSLNLTYIELLEEPKIENVNFLFKFSGSREYYFQNNHKGMLISVLNTEYGEIVGEQKLLTDQITLNAFYIDNEGTQIYDLNVGKINYFGTIGIIIEEIGKGRFNQVVSKERLDEGISNVVRELSKDFTPELVYSYTGIHTDEDGNFELVIPQLKKIFGKNPIQRLVSLQIERMDLIIPKKEYPEEERLIIAKVLSAYLRLLTLDSETRTQTIASFGHILIAPFFKALSKSGKIDVFPANLAIGPHGAGKSSLLRLLTVEFNGREIYLGETCKSPTRLLDILSGSTFPPYIDEIDAIANSKDAINVMKGVLTGMIDSGRKTKDQGWIFTDMTSSPIASSNFSTWLNDDLAIKEGRVILNHFSKPAKEENLTTFKTLESIIKDNPRIGHFVYDQVLEYLKQWRLNENKETLSDLKTLVELINKKHKYILQICKDFNIRFSDNRRVTINAMILLGLEFWNYVFSKFCPDYLLTENFNLTDFITNKNNQLTNYISTFESENYETKLENAYIFDTFLASKCNYISEDEIQIDREDQMIYFTNKCLGDYNAWAIKSDFPTYKKMSDFVDFLSNVLNDTLECKMKRMNKYNSPTRVIPFPYKRIFRKNIPESDISTEPFRIEPKKPNLDEEILSIFSRLKKPCLFEDIYTFLFSKTPIEKSDLTSLLANLEDNKKIRYEVETKKYSLINPTK